MTEEIYNKILPYKPIIELWGKSQAYVGGADELFQIGSDHYGIPLQPGCTFCKAQILTGFFIDLEKYENGSTKG